MDGIIIVNKEKGVTSRYVVNDLVHIFNTKKIGHTGTLDPIAQGVLVVCIGSCTKLSELLTSDFKEYIATIKLGIKTDTLDITGNIIEKLPYKINEKEIKEVLSSFKGQSIQEVPIYSAVKVNGKNLYEYARNNEKVTLPQRLINILDISLIEYKEDTITFKAVVSKGTYIRSLINDICTRLHTVGTMSSLIRTKQGKFSIKDAYTIENIKKGNFKVLTKEEVLDIESINIDESLYQKVKNGCVIQKTFNTDLCSFIYNDKIVAIYKTYHKDKKLAKPYKIF